MKNRPFLPILLFSIALNFGYAQHYNNPGIYQVFDQDSLAGFDETAARASAISQQFLGSEFKIKMYSLKREYINNKYNLVRTAAKAIGTSAYPVLKPTVQPACTNEDFEGSAPGPITSSAQVNGWVLTGGYNGPVNSSSSPTLQSYYPGGLFAGNSCSLPGCCPMPTAHSSIVDCSAGYIDNNISSVYPIYSIFGTSTVPGSSTTNTHVTGGLHGTKVLKINDDLAGDYSIEKLSKTFAVTANNSFFQFAFISFMSSSHPCCDAGGIQVRLVNATTNTLISCPGYTVFAPGSMCTMSVPINYYEVFTGQPYTPSSSFTNMYNPWKVSSVDLTQYIGQTITLEVIVNDCTAGGHFSYAYFDAQCSPIRIGINGTDFIAADSVITYNSCDTLITLTAPGIFSSYQWKGPGAISGTNSVFTTTASGIFTLTLNDPSLCAPITKTISISAAQQMVTISSSANNTCPGEPTILTANNMNNALWNTGNTTPSIYVSPTITTTYFVGGIDINGCIAHASITQTVLNCTGLNTYKNPANAVSIYPNPNNGEFILSIEKEINKAELSIETALGQLVHKQFVQQGNNAIKTKGLSAGVYYYTVTENKRIVSKGKLKVE